MELMMTFEKQDHPDQMSLEPILERAASNRERQRAFRARKKAKGQKPLTLLVTEDEAYHLRRVLEEMRETGGTPAAMRRANGQFYHLDN